PTEIEGRAIDNQLQWFPFTFPFSITGQPAITVPCGFTAEGLPVGLQIVAKRFGDASGLRAAAAFEAAQPWAHRRPSLHQKERHCVRRIALALVVIVSLGCTASLEDIRQRTPEYTGDFPQPYRTISTCIYDRLNSQSGSTVFSKESLSGGISKYLYR